MPTSPAIRFLAALSGSFAKQALDMAKRTDERRARELRNAELEFLCGVEIKDSGWQEWQDTVAEFNAR